MQKKNQIANSKIKKGQINTKEDINILKNFTSNQKSLNYNINEEIYDFYYNRFNIYDYYF